MKLITKCLLLSYLALIRGSMAKTPLSVNHITYPAFNMVTTQQECNTLPISMVECKYNTTTCIYGEQVRVYCVPAMGVKCTNEKKQQDGKVAQLNRSSEWLSRGGHYRMAICRFCHQVDGGNKRDVLTCDAPLRDCSQPGVARSFYMATCRVGTSVLCMGKRKFYRMRSCHRSSGKHYGSTVTLSLFLGGLGADRFYLGMWREGLGKLFTFGGLGVWSLLDFILVTIGYICPKDDLIYWHDP